MYLEDLVNVINRKLKQIEGEKTVLWGAAENTIRLYQYTELGLYSIIDIVDNDKNKIGTKFFGHIVRNPQCIDWKSVGAVIISSYYGEEKICKELKNQYGYDGIIIKLNEKGQKWPFFQYVSKRLLEVSGSNGEVVQNNIKYKNLHQGKRVFILATGPSINQMDLKELKNEYCIAVSGFYNYKNYVDINPRYHCLIDSQMDSSVNKEDVKKEFQWLGDKTEGLDTIFFFGIHDREIVRNLSIFNDRQVNYVSNAVFPDNSIEEIELTHNIPAVVTATIMGIEIALYMGFKEIYLLGVEHTELRDMTYTHFYPKEMFYCSLEASGLTENEEIKDYGRQIQIYANVWKQYDQMKMIAADIYGARIYNASDDTCLDVFERRDYSRLSFN